MPTLPHERESFKAVQAKVPEVALYGWVLSTHKKKTLLVGNQGGEISGTLKANIAPCFHLGVLDSGTM